MSKQPSNALNALKSTGPATAEGRAVSARNSVRHGVLSLSPTVKGESSSDWRAFHAGLVESLSPVGTLEDALVGRIALALWRHRRLIAWETDAVDVFRARHGDRPSSFDYELTRVPDPRLLEAVCRYEAHLGRQFRSDLHDLQRLQAARKGEPMSLPVAVDVNWEAPSVTKDEPVEP